MRSMGAQGLALAVLSAAAFGTSGTFAAALLSAGWTPGAAVTVRLAVAALVLTVPAVRQLRGRWSLLRRCAGPVAAYGLVAVAGCQLCYFNAIEHVSVGVGLLLEYLGTILVVGWLWLRRGQRPRRLTVAGGAVAIGGLVLVLDLAGAHRLDPVGVAWGLAAAAGLAVYFMLSAQADEVLPPLVMAWGAMVVATTALVLLAFAGLPFRAPRADVQLVDHQVSWLVSVLGLGLVATATAYVAGIAAARSLGAKVASFVGLTEVVCSVLFAWLLLGQVPAGVQFAGGLLIVAGVVLVRLDELRGAAPERGQSAGAYISEPGVVST